MSTELHKKLTPKNLRIAIISVSTSRQELSEDQSGLWMKKQAKKEGHEVVVHHLVNDDIAAI